MNRLLVNLLLLISLNLSAQYGGDYFVAVNGDDNNPGTIEQPWATWNKAFITADAGDTVYFRGGVYYSTQKNRIDPEQSIGHSGTASNPIVYAGYPPDILAGNWPILDCYQHCDSIPPNPWGGMYNSAIYIRRAEYIKLKCLEIRNVYQCDSVVTGAIAAEEVANITYERIRAHDIGERGFYHVSGAWGYADSVYAVDVYGQTPEAATPIFMQPDTTRWINCDVWNVCDTFVSNPGNAGDCWKTINYNGNYHYWEGCRAWNYSDDGFDPNNGKRVFKNCWAMATKKYDDFGVEGNGFKTSSLRTDQIVYNTPEDYQALISDSMVQTIGCLALFCPGVGFYHGLESDTTDNPLWYNNTAYKCGIGFESFSFSLDSIGDKYHNNISYASTLNDAIGNPANILTYTKYAESNNTWRWKSGYPYAEDNPNFTVTDDDFETVDTLELVALFTAPRNPDGSLPLERPMMLDSTSDLIDGGINIGSLYCGLAPDLGYSEYDNTITSCFQLQDTTNTNSSVEILYTGNGSTSATYYWDFGCATVISGSGQGPYTVQWPSGGCDTVSLYVEESNVTSDLTAQEIFIIGNSPTSGFQIQDTAYMNSPVNIVYTGNASPSATYHWDFDGATIISGSGQGPYTLEWPGIGDKTVSLYVEESGFVSDTSTNEIYIVYLTSDFLIADTACIAGPVDITYTGNATSPAIYHWDFDGATIISGSGQGPYTVQWSGIGDKTVSLYLEESGYFSDTTTNNISIEYLSSDFQLPDTAGRSCAVDIIYTGNASDAAIYHWDFDNATLVSGSGQGPYTVQWQDIGDKTVSLYVEESNFASDTTTNDIYIEYLTSDFQIADTACIAGPVDIVYTGNASDTASYNWDFDGANILSGSGQGPYTVQWPGLGNKTVSLYIHEAGYVSDTTTNSINIENLTSDFQVADFACISSIVVITYSGNASDSAIYYWDFDNSTIVSGSGQGPYLVEWPNAGDKTVRLFVEESGYVSDTSSNEIHINDTPVFTIIPYPNDTVSTLDTITLTADIISASYLWSSGETTQSIQVFNSPPGILGDQSYWLMVTDEYGCSSTNTISVWFDNPVQINDFPNKIELKVYPNPVNDVLNIELEIVEHGQYLFEVFDHLGRPVIRELRSFEPGAQKMHLDMNRQTPGVYILSVKSDNGMIGVTKILK